MSDKDFKVKNKLQVKGITSAGPVVSDASGNIDSVPYIATQYGGTGTTTSPNAGQILYSQSGTTYLPSDISVLFPSQTGNDGKFLKTDGTTISWETVSASGGGLTGYDLVKSVENIIGSSIL